MEDPRASLKSSLTVSQLAWEKPPVTLQLRLISRIEAVHEALQLDELFAAEALPFCRAEDDEVDSLQIARPDAVGRAHRQLEEVAEVLAHVAERVGLEGARAAARRGEREERHGQLRAPRADARAALPAAGAKYT